MVNKTKTKVQLNAYREVNMKFWINQCVKVNNSSSTNEPLHYYLLFIRQIEGFSWLLDYLYLTLNKDI